ncbi:LL-diaminopimelate aminotransferase, partial [PVC group bacterium]|nr:LL-diaminopimelate aminotransferase [PVC group bacterium]
QLLFGGNVTVAVQDRPYPVYIDGSVIIGATGDVKNAGQFDRIRYMPCLPQNDFFPDLKDLPKTDIIYFCSPNNPTGAAASREQLAELVSTAKELSAILVFDAAYAEFIQDKNIPKSIYEIDGAREVAIEVNSFSKMIGFTGVRLGWTVVPKDLRYQDGHSVNQDWLRVMTTIFNGASILAQQGGLAALEEEGRKECHSAIQYYMNNVRMIAEKLQSLGLRVYGGKNAPYVWASFPGLDSWDVFEEILTKTHVVTTPGSGFGPSGQGFVRFSAFGQKKNVEEAMDRLMNAKFSWRKPFK